jgi:predicted AlkP superfamily phosphohydrolase/phosphomutase
MGRATGSAPATAGETTRQGFWVVARGKERMDRLNAHGGESSSHASGEPRVLVIGLDGATFRLLDDWMDRGIMPNLQRVVKEGTRAILRSVMPPVTAPAWTSFATGVRPGRHGVFDFWKREAGTDRPRIVGVRDMLVPPIWDLLINAGVRVGLVNVPVSYPPPEQASFAISDMMAPSTAPGFTQPPTLLDELRPVLGEYIVDGPPLQSCRRAAVEAFLEGLEHHTRQQARYTEHLMTTRDWDFCMVVFQATDWIQHRMWDALSGEYVIYPQTPEIVGLRDRAEKFVSVLDEEIGRLVSACPPETDIFFVSDHGAGPLRRRVRINQWLARKGLLKYSRRKMLRRLVAGLDVLGLRRHVRSFLGRGKGKVAPSVSRWIEWQGTRAYAATRSDMGVHVNLQGRELGGIVSSEEYEDVRDAVVAAMGELRHPETGEPMVTAAFRREELFEGPGVANAPDLLFLLDDGACNPDLSPDGPLFEDTTWASWTGTHRVDGILIARGPRIQRAQRMGEVDIIDIAPVLLHLFGVHLPGHMEGRSPEGLLTAEAREAVPWREPTWGDDDGRGAGEPPERAYTEEETRQVEERLQDLGYL